MTHIAALINMRMLLHMQIKMDDDSGEDSDGDDIMAVPRTETAPPASALNSWANGMKSIRGYGGAPYNQGRAAKLVLSLQTFLSKVWFGFTGWLIHWEPLMLAGERHRAQGGLGR